MRLTPDEQHDFDQEEAIRTNHEPLLHQYFERQHGPPTGTITIRHLRDRYIVIGQVAQERHREVIPFNAQFLEFGFPAPDNDASESISSHHSISSHNSDDSDDADSFNLAICSAVDCQATGPLGQVCTADNCIDSGNLYSDILRPASQVAFDQEYWERTGIFRRPRSTAP